MESSIEPLPKNKSSLNDYDIDYKNLLECSPWIVVYFAIWKSDRTRVALRKIKIPYSKLAANGEDVLEKEIAV